MQDLCLINNPIISKQKYTDYEEILPLGHFSVWFIHFGDPAFNCVVTKTVLQWTVNVIKWSVCTSIPSQLESTLNGQNLLPNSCKFFLLKLPLKTWEKSFSKAGLSPLGVCVSLNIHLNLNECTITTYVNGHFIKYHGYISTCTHKFLVIQKKIKVNNCLIFSKGYNSYRNVTPPWSYNLFTFTVIASGSKPPTHIIQLLQLCPLDCFYSHYLTENLY